MIFCLPNIILFFCFFIILCLFLVTIFDGLWWGLDFTQMALTDPSPMSATWFPARCSGMMGTVRSVWQIANVISTTHMVLTRTQMQRDEWTWNPIGHDLETDALIVRAITLLICLLNGSLGVAIHTGWSLFTGSAVPESFLWAYRGFHWGDYVADNWQACYTGTTDDATQQR